MKNQYDLRLVGGVTVGAFTASIVGAMGLINLTTDFFVVWAGILALFAVLVVLLEGGLSPFLVGMAIHALQSSAQGFFGPPPTHIQQFIAAVAGCAILFYMLLGQILAARQAQRRRGQN